MTRRSKAIAAVLGGAAATGAGADPAAAMLPAADGGGPPPTQDQNPPQGQQPPQGQGDAGQTDRKTPPSRQPAPPPRTTTPASTQPQGNTQPQRADPKPTPRRDARALADTYEQIDAQDGALNTGLANRLQRYGQDAEVRQRAQRIVKRRQHVRESADQYVKVLDQIDAQDGALNMNTANGLRRYGQDPAVVRRARQIRAANRAREEDREREEIVDNGGIAESEDPGQHVLTERGFDEADTRRSVRRFTRKHDRVGLRGLMADRNHRTEPLNQDVVDDVEGVEEDDGYSWEDSDDYSDNDVPYWMPQGISGRDGMQAITWYENTKDHDDSDGPTPGRSSTRISFVGKDKRDYRNALLVRPTEDGDFEQVDNHAGGNAWQGHFMYVADTSYGVRVFDTRKIVRAPAGRDHDTGGYGYMLPEVGSYEYTGRDQDPDTRLRFSSLSIDRSNPGRPALVVSEYVRHGDGEDDDPRSRRTRIVRWDIDPRTGKLTRSRASAAYETGVDEVQGAAMHDGRVYMSSGDPAGRDGALYSGTPGENAPVDEDPWIGGSPESLYVEGAELWSLNEHHGERTVFHARRSNYDD